MMIRYASKTGEVVEVLNRLNKLTLAFQEEIDPKTPKPVLEDGGKVIEGHSQILSHLTSLESELDEWYYCGC